NKLDSALREYIRRTHGVAIGDQTAEELKKTLASALPVNPDVIGSVKGRDIVTGLPKTVKVTRNELAKAIKYELDTIVKAIKTVLEQTPPELASDIIDNGIVMTGGTSLLAHLPQLIQKESGVKVRLADDALLAVASGTGILLEHLDDYKRS